MTFDELKAGMRIACDAGGRHLKVTVGAINRPTRCLQFEGLAFWWPWDSLSEVQEICEPTDRDFLLARLRGLHHLDQAVQSHSYVAESGEIVMEGAW